MKACERGNFLINDFFQNGIRKSEVLDLVAELTCATDCRVSPGHLI